MTRTHDATARFIHDSQRRILGLFQQIHSAEVRTRDRPNHPKPHLMELLFRELDIYSTIEREIVYPAVRNSADENPGDQARDALASTEEGLERHDAIEQLLRQAEGRPAEAEEMGSLLDELETVTRLQFHEEERRVLPFIEARFQSDSIDVALRAQKRRDELLASSPPVRELAQRA